jgi:hypothetical protein
MSDLPWRFSPQRFWLWFSHRYLYPWSDGAARRKDPTYGRTDRDIQWFVNDILRPKTLGQRVAHESNLQEKRATR